MDRVPVLVVGAGPVGLAAAVQLRPHGVRFRIVEKNAERTLLSKALVVWPRTLELLRASGVAANLVAAGLQGTAATISSCRRTLVRLRLDRADSPYPFALFIPQSETERLLEAHLAAHDIRVERETELVGFEPDGQGVTAHLKRADGGEETLRADWIIACDGAHSAIRHRLALPFSGTTETTQFLLADIHVGGLAPDAGAKMFFHPDGVMALFPIGPAHFRMIAFLGAFEEKRPDPTLAQIQELLDRRGPGGLTASDPVWLAYFRINERKLKDYRAGRIFFAGDAAHVHSPAGGQGMNTGIQDVCNLVWKLALVCRGAASAPLLDSYSAERSAVGDLVLRNAGAITRMATLRNPILLAVRNTTVTLLGRLPAVQKRFVRAMSELDIAYPNSPLSRNGARRAGGPLRSGDRASDAALIGPTGERVALIDLISDRRFTLLALGEREAMDDAARAAWDGLVARFGENVALIPISTKLEAPDPDASPRYADVSGRIARDYGRSGLVLVRPDLYLGLVAGPGEWQAVESYLATILTAPP